MYNEYLEKLENLKGKELKNTELKAEKIELGAIDDLTDNYNKLLSKVLPHMKKAYQEANEISKISTNLLDLSQNAEKLVKMAKELGADSVQKTAEKLAKNALTKFKYYSKIAEGISKAANK